MSDAERYALDAQKARKTGPLQGDVCVIDGAEYVYGKNTKYMDSPAEPVYVWVPRHFYKPSFIDMLPGRVGRPTKPTKELAELQQRLAKLEQAIRGKSAPEAPRPEKPPKDATGRSWTLYFANDDGVEWYLDEDARSKPSAGPIQIWRKRVFPRWALQKELVTLDEIDCREARYRTRELQVTNWDGANKTFDKVTLWANIFSSSPEEYLMNEYCK